MGIGMSEWGYLFDRAMALLAAEPAPIVIAIVLAIALSAAFMVEGARVTLTPRRRVIRHLQLHAPDDGSPIPQSPISQSYEVVDFDGGAMGFAQPGEQEQQQRPMFRSAGSRRPQLARAPRDLLDRDHA
jgi:hypothetical protein